MRQPHIARVNLLKEIFWRNIAVQFTLLASNRNETLAYCIFLCNFRAMRSEWGQHYQQHTHSSCRQKWCDRCINQYIGQGAETREAIKNLDEKLSKKLDQLIKLLQPSPTPGKNVFSTIRSNSQCSFLFILSWN